MIDRKAFFDAVREAPFGGSLSQSQVDGMTQILDEWERRQLKDERWLAYMLATVFHETARKMQPIEEMGGQTYLRGKPYYPWYGRGLVQITWEANYKKFGITNPEDALTWPVALRVLFEGMIKGVFTGWKLGIYFNLTVDDPVQARTIINGKDKAELIAGYHRAFQAAIIDGVISTSLPPLSLPPVIPPAPKPKPSFWAWVFGKRA